MTRHSSHIEEHRIGSPGRTDSSQPPGLSVSARTCWLSGLALAQYSRYLLFKEPAHVQRPLRPG